MAKENYFTQKDLERKNKTQYIINNQLPLFLKDYFNSIDSNVEISTKLAYAQDLLLFFTFVKNNNPIYTNLDISTMPLEILDNLTRRDLDEYITTLPKNASTRRRKISALRSMYNYFSKNEDISKNPAALINMPKQKRDKNIVLLEPDEQKAFFNTIKYKPGNTSEHQNAYLEKTSMRDYAIFTLLIDTGIRISELVGIDIDDVDIAKNSVLIKHRKGGVGDIVYLSDKATDILKEYIELDRQNYKPDDNEKALFLSMRHNRIAVRSVQELAKKYGTTSVPLKNIHAHSFRKTFGTNMYRKTNDIYITADLLSHTSIQTTVNFYVPASQDAKKEHRNDSDMSSQE